MEICSIIILLKKSIDYGSQIRMRTVVYTPACHRKAKCLREMSYLKLVIIADFNVIKIHTTSRFNSDCWNDK